MADGRSLSYTQLRDLAEQAARRLAARGVGAGDRVAVLINSFGATPLMELYILFRRVEQRLSAKDIKIEANWVGHYCTSLDMVGVIVCGVREDRISWARLYVEPVEHAGEGIEVAVREMAGDETH